MMWGVIIFVAFSYVAADQETSHGIRVNCEREDDKFPNVSDVAAPSLLKDLKLEHVKKGGKDWLNISWAINVDVSINYLTGTRIRIEGEATYICEYNPPLAKANLTLKQVWFHYEARVSAGLNVVDAANLPLPPPENGVAYLSKTLWISKRKPTTTTEATVKTTVYSSQVSDPKLTENGNHLASIVVAVLGGLVGLMVLISCVIIYKVYGKHFATSLGFTKLPTSPTVPVSVLLVYPAENPAFQKVVVALAEFLQWHGGCSVAVDMWQQGKIAELGPMRWLAEQAEAAKRVIVICPQLNLCPPSHSLPGHSIPAAAHDLYPLVLNMVGSHAKSPSDLAKFWTVQLGEQQDEKPGSLAVELRACKSFCLMKDLNTLCRSLHVQRQDAKKTLGLKFRPEISYSEKNTEKLRDAIRQLARRHPSTTKELEPLKTVIMSI